MARLLYIIQYIVYSVTMIVLTMTLMAVILFAPVAAIFATELHDAARAREAKARAIAELQVETEETKISEA